MPKRFEGEQIADCWEQIVSYIVENGHFVDDERGSKTKEVLNVLATIKDPFHISSGDFFGFGDKIASLDNIRIPEGYFWEGDKLEKYSEQFISGENPGFVYTYGNRLRAHFEGIDQIRVAIDRLKNCQESRRAISVTWDPTEDTKVDEVPCMILVDFKIRDNTLYTTGLWRSHDIFGAWFPNAVGLSYLAHYVSEELGSNIHIGPITIHSISAHIYGNDLKLAEKVKVTKP